VGCNSVDTATCYRLDAQRIESRWGEIFRPHTDRPRVTPCLISNGYRVSFPRWRGQGVALTTTPRLKKEWSNTSTPLQGLHGLYLDELYVSIYFNIFHFPFLFLLSFLSSFLPSILFLTNKELHLISYDSRRFVDWSLPALLQHEQIFPIQLIFLHYLSTTAAGYSETSALMCQNAWRHIPHNRKLHISPLKCMQVRYFIEHLGIPNKTSTERFSKEFN
jgi:hypothetical protein